MYRFGFVLEQTLGHISHGRNVERAGEDEITILVRGKWSDYQVSYTWMFDLEALHLACAFELKVPEHCRAEVAFVMVSTVVKVLEEMTNSVSAGSRSRTASCRSAPSTLETNRNTRDRSAYGRSAS